MRQRRPRTVVINGASSGIGRATALAFAERGDTLTLVARRQEALETLATECRGHGATVQVAPADVADDEALAHIARTIVDQYGHLDVWVNNAAVVAYGRTEEMPARIWHQVLKTNLFGYYHGVRAALPWFREQGAGVLINVSSVFGKTPAPYQSAYVASKSATRVLSDAVRQEVADVKGISVCTVLPGAVDTPMFRNGANLTGRQIRPPSPAIDARRVAAAIVRCAKRPRNKVLVGASTRSGMLAARLMPRLTEKVAARVVDRVHFGDQPVSRSDGNLFTPRPTGARIDDGWRHTNGHRRRRIVVGATAAAAAGALAVRAARHRGGR